MGLGERLKKVRESLGYTQKEIAEAINTNPQTWRVYEAGKSVPGGNVLDALARLGINVNWLLTGLGSMWVVTAGDVWSEKMRELRGDLNIPQFVNKLGFNDPDNAIETIQAIENGKLDPDLSLLGIFQDILGISLDWFLGWHDAPKIRLGSILNIDLLKDIVKEAELYESINPGSLSPEKKAELIAELYAMRAEKERK